MRYLSILTLALFALATLPSQAAEDYNSSRSNKSLGAAAVNDHNTTSSNQTQPTATEDSDSDSDIMGSSSTKKREAGSGMATGKRQHKP